MHQTQESILIDSPPLKKHADSSARTHRLTVQTLTTNAEFDRVEERWSALVEQSNATIYQTYEWQRTWWKYFAEPDHTLRILLFSHEDRPVGIVPLYMRTSKILGLPYARHLQFIGHGLSDYCELIAFPGFEREVIGEFVSYLRSSRHQWDILDLEDVNESAIFFALLPEILEESHFHMIQYQGNVCPQIVLPASGVDSAKDFDPAKSEHTKRKLKRLQQNFKAEMEVIQKETDDIERGVDAFAYIHGQRWKNLGYPSAFDDDHLKSFHVEFSRKFARRNWLRMFFLKVDDEPIAVSYTFYYKHRAYMYHSNAHGTDEIMRCSPGFLIRNAALVEAINLKMEIFDYLRGDEPYKYKEWEAVDSKNYLLRIVSPSLSSKPRIVLFYAKELSHKALIRTQRELFEYKRFKIIRKRSLVDKAGYITIKGLGLGTLGFNFILRHQPVPAFRKYQLKQRSFHEEVFGGSGGKARNKFHPAVFLGEWWSTTARELRPSRITARLRLLRYGETTLASVEPGMDQTLRVVQSGPERRLMVVGDQHPIIFLPRSVAELKREYWGELLETPFPLPATPKILILGAGGSAMIRLFEGTGDPSRVTIIEKNPRLADFAREFFGVDQGTVLLVGDMKPALRKMQTDGTKFDFVIDTATVETADLSKEQEIALCRQYLALLSPGGLIALRRSPGPGKNEERLSALTESLRQLKLDVVRKQVRERWEDDLLYIRTARRSEGSS